jgi:hypothetical protein
VTLVNLASLATEKNTLKKFIRYKRSSLLTLQFRNLNLFSGEKIGKKSVSFIQQQS